MMMMFQHCFFVQEFIRNNRGIDGGHSLPTYYLVDLYECIRGNPIRLHDDRLFSEEQTEDEEYWVGHHNCGSVWLHVHQ